jgi:hypothetical protein
MLTVVHSYVDWNNYNTATSDYVRNNWAIATVLSSTIMATAMLYIVTEWCLQSHLSTANMNDAARGLYLTRRFRWLTSPFRSAVHYTIEGVYAVRKLIMRTWSRDNADSGIAEAGQHRRSVRWTKHPAARTVQDTSSSKDIQMDDLTPGRPRASSEAPLIENRDVYASPPSVSDAETASRQTHGARSQSPRASNGERISQEIEPPGSLHVPYATLISAQPSSDRRLSA